MKFPLWWSRVYLHIATYGKMFVEGLLLVTDVSTSLVEVIFRVKSLLEIMDSPVSVFVAEIVT